MIIPFLALNALTVGAFCLWPYGVMKHLGAVAIAYIAITAALFFLT